MRNLYITAATLALASLMPVAAQETAQGFGALERPDHFTELTRPEQQSELVREHLGSDQFTTLVFKIDENMTDAEIEALKNRVRESNPDGLDVNAVTLLPEYGGVVTSPAFSLDVFRTETGLKIVPRDKNRNATNDPVLWLGAGGTGNTVTQTVIDLMAAGVIPRYHLLIDQSGSMVGHMDAVKTAALQFINDAQGLCRLTWYNSETTHMNNGEYKACDPANFLLDGYEANGGTDAAPAIREALTALSVPLPNAPDNAPNIASCIIVSDGHSLTQEDVDDFKSFKTPCFLAYIGSEIDDQFYSQFIAQTIDNAADAADIKGAFTQFTNNHVYARYLEIAAPVEEATEEVAANE